MSGVLHVGREEFVHDLFDYEPGESIAIIGPTGTGKTYTGWQLINEATRQNPQLAVTALQPKPADDTTAAYVQNLGLEVRDAYPFRKRLLHAQPYGYVHWPRHIKGDEEANIAHLHDEFSRSLSGEYWAGHKLVLVDDTYLIAAYYKCSAAFDKYLIAGRSNKAGVVACLQQPRGTVQGGAVSSFVYNQPTHLLLGKDGNRANRERFGEIGMGLDPRMIESVVAGLRVYRVNGSAVSQLLYLDRRGPYLCVVDPW